MSEWKPIETAPKDESHILVSDGKYVEKAYFDNELEKWIEAWDGDVDFHDLIHPTHWMPLPKPPEQD